MIESCMYWAERGRLAGSCMPGDLGDLIRVRSSGVRRVVVLPEDYEIADRWGSSSAYFEALSALGLEFLHEPVPDMEAPTLEQLLEILRWIREGPTLVHCVGGLGRTGTVVASWLVVERGMSAREAIERVRSLRPGSVQSYSQHLFLVKVEGMRERIRALLEGGLTSSA